MELFWQGVILGLVLTVVAALAALGAGALYMRGTGEASRRTSGENPQRRGNEDSSHAFGAEIRRARVASLEGRESEALSGPEHRVPKAGGAQIKEGSIGLEERAEMEAGFGADDEAETMLTEKRAEIERQWQNMLVYSGKVQTAEERGLNKREDDG